MNKDYRINLNIIVNIITFLVTTLTSFIVTPHIIKYVNIEAYGIIGLANNFTNYITIITAALNSMASRFIIIELHKSNYIKANKYFNSVLMANTIISLILLIPSILFITRLELFLNFSNNLINDAKWTFLIIFINFIFGLITSVFSIVYYAKNILYVGSLRNLESNFLRVGFIFLLFLIFGIKIQYVSIATLLSAIYTIAFNYYYTRKLIPELKINICNLDIKCIFNLINSGIWNSIGRLSQILLDGLDLVITNIFISASITGSISITKTFTTLMITFLSLISDGFMPKFLKDFTNNDSSNEFVKSIILSMRYLGFVFNIMCAGLIVYCKDLYHLWVPTENSSFLTSLTLLGLGPIIISGSIYSLFNVFTVTNKVKQNSLIMLITGVFSTLTVFILLNTTSLGVYAIVGVSSFYGILRNLFFTPIYAAKCIGVKSWVFYRQILRNLFSLLILVILFSCIRANFLIDNWGSFIGVISISGLIAIFFNFLLVFTKEEKKALSSKVITSLK